jgi:hypothetical protein
VRQAFWLPVKPRATGVVVHPARTFLIDREGTVQYRDRGRLLAVMTIVEPGLSLLIGSHDV